MKCNCPRIDGYVVITSHCPHHEAARERRRLAAEAPTTAEPPYSEDDIERQCAWADYRKDYGPNDLKTAHVAFNAGWAAARGVLDAGGPLR